MRFSTLAVAAAAAGSAMAASESICDKYTMALLKENTGANQYTLLSLLVNTAVIGNFTGPGTKQSKLPGSMVKVPGILATDAMYMGMPVNLLQYFDGSLVSTNAGGMAKAVSFLDGGGATPIEADPTSSGKEGSNQYMLLTHLYQYFGALLGCTQYGKTGFSAYQGQTSMYDVHRFMDLSETEFAYFVTQVGLAAQSFGVSSSDITAAATALNSTFGYACSPPAMVVPNSPKQLQAICVAEGCPTATAGAVCSSYSSEMRPVAASSSGSMSMSMSSMSSMATGSAMMSSSAPAGEKTDGQPTVTSIGSTAAAAPLVTAMPVVAAGLAGLAALAL